DSSRDMGRIAERRQSGSDRSIPVVADHLVHQLTNCAALGDRVDPSAADKFSHLVLDDRLRGRQIRSPCQHPQGREHAETTGHSHRMQSTGHYLWITRPLWITLDDVPARLTHSTTGDRYP